MIIYINKYIYNLRTKLNKKNPSLYHLISSKMMFSYNQLLIKIFKCII